MDLKSGTIAIAIIVTSVVGGILYARTAFSLDLVWTVGSVGAVTFFGTLLLVKSVTGSSNFKKGEMRKALAASLIVVYFVLVSLVMCESCTLPNSDILDTLVGHYTYLIGIVIAFYFGNRAVEVWAKNRPGSTPSSTEDG